MKKILPICAALTAFAIATTANAADMPVRGPYKYAPPPSAVFNWSGFYVGGHLAYGFGDAGTIDIDGFAGGVQAGYNWQFSPNIVFGLEVDISGTDINGFAGGIPVHVDYLGTARARIGYTWDRTMIYGTGGFAFSRAAAAGFHDTDTGWVIGGGLEWAYSNQWSAKAEYLHHDLGTGFEVSLIKLGVNYRFNSGY